MKRLSLRLSIVVALAIGLLIPHLIVTSGDKGDTEARVLESLRADLDQTTDILAAAMRDPLWQVSPDLGRPILQAMFRDARLVAVIVRETGKEAAFLDIYRSVSATAPTLSKARSIVFEGRELGNIRVTMSAGPELARHRRDAEATRWRLLLSGVCSTLLVLLVLQWRLVLPLGRLAARLRQDAGTEETPLPPVADELRPLARAIDHALGRARGP